MNSLTPFGVPLVGSPYVPEDKLLRLADGTIAYHERISLRVRYRRPHGRVNGPRRPKVKFVRYAPMLDALLAKEATHG